MSPFSFPEKPSNSNLELWEARLKGARKVISPDRPPDRKIRHSTCGLRYTVDPRGISIPYVRGYPSG